MIPAVCLLLLPVVFSAVLNPFDKFKKPVFIKNHFFDYLPLREQMKFMLTCREYYKFLDIEYEKILQKISGSQSSYEEADGRLKADLKKIWKYFMVEMEHRNVRDTFKVVEFYEMIQGYYFTNPVVLTFTKTDNANAFKNIFGFEHHGHVLVDTPHFPEISTILLKSPHAPIERSSLIENACRSPHLFDDFFKHLALNIYKVPRDELPEKLRKEFSQGRFRIFLKIINSS